MAFTDAFGTWRELSVVPIEATTDWQIFPLNAPGTLFRFYFFANWGKWSVPQGFRSFGYIRSYYRDDGGATNNLVTPALPIYPKQEAMLIEIPILKSLEDNPYSFRKIGFKKIVTKRPYPKQWLVSDSSDGRPPVLDWSLAIEYLIDGT